MSSPAPSPERVVSTDGTSIAIWRSGEGPPLVAVHGVTIDHTAWDPMRPWLDPKRTLYALDRRGHGTSQPGGSSYRLDSEVSDLLTVLEGFPAPVDVLAHSFGGLVALEAACSTDRIDRLVVYEPSVDDDPDFPDVLARITALVDEGRIEEAAVTLLVERSGVPSDAIDAVREMPLWPIVLDGVRTLPREGAILVGYRFDPARFASLDTPILALVGGDSPGWRHAAVEALHAALPASELRVLAGHGHLATHTGPEALATETLRFLDHE
jgi:pimeloyl-ACP methyl ester carboxylesterase